jgi:ribonuclease J
LVDGIGVGDVGSVVLRDRKHLGQDGLIVIVVTIDSMKNCIVAGPDIVSRGFVYMRESEVLIDEAKRAAVKSLNNSLSQRVRDWSGLKMRLKDDLFKLFHEKTRRNPVILPIIMAI